MKDPVPRELRSRVVYINSLVHALKLVTSAKVVDIFLHASVNTSLLTNPLTFSNIYKGRNFATNPILQNALKS